MRLGHDQAPAAGADALDEPDHVARLVYAILLRAEFIAESDRTKENLPHRVARKQDADLPLRSVELLELLQVPLRSHAAGKCRIRHIVEHAFRLCADLD